MADQLTKVLESLASDIAGLRREVNRLKIKEGGAGGGGGSGGTWASWSPSVIQGGVVSTTTHNARYVVNGDTVNLLASIGVTGAGSAGNVITVTGIPEAFAWSDGSDYTTVGISTWFVSASDDSLIASVVATGSSIVNFIGLGDDSYLGTNEPTLADTDIISFVATYERTS